MILKNNKGIQKEVDILLEIEMNNKKYIIYKNPENDNIYAGVCEKDKLCKLDDEEHNKLERIYEEMGNV